MPTRRACPAAHRRVGRRVGGARPPRTGSARRPADHASARRGHRRHDGPERGRGNRADRRPGTGARRMRATGPGPSAEFGFWTPDRTWRLQAHVRPAVQAGRSAFAPTAPSTCRLPAPSCSRRTTCRRGTRPVRRRARSADPLDGQGRGLRGEPRARGVPEARRRLRRTPRRGRPRRSFARRDLLRRAGARHVRRGHPAADRGDRRREARGGDDRPLRGCADRARGDPGHHLHQAGAAAPRDVHVRAAAGRGADGAARKDLP